MGSFSPPTLKIGQRAKTHCWVPSVGCRVHSDGASFLRWAKKKPLKPLLGVKTSLKKLRAQFWEFGVSYSTPFCSWLCCVFAALGAGVEGRAGFLHQVSLEVQIRPPVSLPEMEKKHRRLSQEC